MKKEYVTELIQQGITTDEMLKDAQGKLSGAILIGTTHTGRPMLACTIDNPVTIVALLGTLYAWVQAKTGLLGEETNADDRGEEGKVH